MKKALSLLLVCALAGAVLGNGVSFNSPGTRAISMGGAYISIVDDYSAPYWNPAGLMNVNGMQASFFITDLIPMASYKLDTYGIDAKAKKNNYFAPNTSFLWTCRLYDKLHMGLSFIVPAGVGTEWEGEDFVPFAGPAEVPNPYAGGVLIPNPYAGSIFNWESYIGVWNLSLSAAYNFGDKLNIGGAFHFVHGDMTLKRGIDAVNIFTGGPGEDTMLDTQYEEESSGNGIGFGMGLQYMFNEKLTMGAAMRTQMTVEFSGDAEFGAIEDDFDRDVSWPLWIGGGLAYRVNERLLLAVEAQWSQWSETEDYLIAEYDQAGKDTLNLLWDDAVQIRFGAEYLLNEQWALRGGFYIDPAPGPDDTQTILIPNTDFNVITGGVGYKMDKLSFDLAFEYLMGKERDIDSDEVMEGVGMPGKHNLNIFVPSFAVTYKF